MKQFAASISKLSRPDAGNIFPRERLFRLLDQGTCKPACWISAPAGSGKSSLVASWLNWRSHPCIWYQLDGSDQDPASFFYYLRQAEARLNRRKRKLLPLFSSDYLQDVAAFARRYFEELFGRMSRQLPADSGPERSVLVLDDYQELPAHSVLHDILRQAIEAVPERVAVVIVSRGGAPSQLARLRANNRMALMGWSDLRLSPEESLEILRLNGLEAERPAIARQLHDKADGWAAGLILMMGMARVEGPDAQLSLEQSREDVFDYFAHEIFKNSTPEIRDFLLKTAFAPFMTTGMAQRLAGVGQAGRFLAELSRDNYFTDWRAGATPVYQYHPLFRDFLRERARASLPPEALTATLRHTAAVLQEAGYLNDAVELFAGAGDFAGLSGLIATHAQALVEQGRSKTVEQWLSHLPAAAFAADPWLSYWRGACLHPLDIPASHDAYAAAFRGLLAAGETAGALLAWGGVGINIITEWRQFSRLDRQIDLLTPELEGEIEYLPADLQARLLGVILLSFSFRQPWHANVLLYEQRAGVLIRSNVLTLENLVLLGAYLLIHYTKMGQLAKAKVLIEVVEPRTRDKQSEFCLALGLWRMLTASYHGLTAAKEPCLDGVAEALALSDSTGMHVYDIFTLFYGALAGFIDLDPRVIEDFLERIASVQGAPGLIYPIVHRQVLGWKRMAAGDYRGALEHVEAALELTRSHEAPIEIAINVVARAQVLFELGRRQEALDSLHEVRHGNAAHSDYIRYMLDCTLAYFAFCREDDAAGVCYLRQAMAVGCEQRIAMHHFWTPKIMARLCCQALQARIEPEYVRELIVRHRLSPDRTLLNSAQWPWPLKILTLGGFRIEKQGERLAFAGKKQEKPLSLLKALVVHGERGAPLETLCDLLWPSADGDAAHSSLKMALSRLRRLLGEPRLIESREGWLALNRKMCWVDAWAFKETLARIDAHLGGGEAAAEPCAAIAPWVDELIRVYCGEFLRGEKTEYWELAFRERLHRSFLQLLKKHRADHELRDGVASRESFR